MCSLFVAELFTVLLTYISKSQPFQDGRTMCRSVPVSMRGWCRSPPVGGTAGRWRRCRGGWGWATRRCRSWRGPGVCSGASCRATASYCSHRSATTQLVLAWRSQPRPRPLVMILGGGGWARGDTPCHGRAATSPASPNLQCQPSHCTIHHDTTVLCIFIYLDTYLKYLSMADTMGGLLITF